MPLFGPVVGFATTAEYDAGTDFTKAVSPGLLGLDAAFVATMSGNQAIANNTSTKAAFDTAAINKGGYFNTALNRYVPLYPGLYEIHFECTWVAGVAGSVIDTRIYANGGAVAQNENFRVGVGVESMPTVSVLQALNGTTDYVEAYVRQITGVSQDIFASSTFTRFWGRRVGSI